MSQEIFVVRKLTLADVSQVSEVHSNAFPKYMNVKLGRHYVEAMFSWFLHNPAAITLGAFKDSALVGYVMGVQMDQLSRLSRDLLPSALGGIVRHPWLLFSPKLLSKVLDRLRELIVCRKSSPWSTLPTPVMGLFGIAVAAEARGQGAGAVLMRQFEAESLLRGSESMVLSVYPDNTSARTLYEQSGWVVGPYAKQARSTYYSKRLI